MVAKIQSQQHSRQSAFSSSSRQQEKERERLREEREEREVRVEEKGQDTTPAPIKRNLELTRDDFTAMVKTLNASSCYEEKTIQFTLEPEEKIQISMWRTDSKQKMQVLDREQFLEIWVNFKLYQKAIPKGGLLNISC